MYNLLPKNYSKYNFFVFLLINIRYSMYNIDQFSQITNINKLVLRTWENRYGLFKATRTKTNIRVYSDDLLVKALNIKSLTENGF